MKTAGFTLLEVLIVIAIIGILAGIAIVSYLNFRNSVQLGDAAATITRAFSQASVTVRRTSRPATIAFNTSTRTVNVTSNGSSVMQSTLPVDTLTITCRTTCTTPSFPLVSPGGTLRSDLAINMTRGNKTYSMRILGPSAMVVRP